MIPYGRQSINDDDIRAVERVLKSDRLTQGPEVTAFESALASYCGARFAVVAANGTAALHAAYHAAGIEAGDEIVTSAMTFVATANAALYFGAKPVLVDIDPATGAIDHGLIEESISDRTKAVVPIHYMGRPVAFDEINNIAKRHGLMVIEDGCQALGADYGGRKIGNLGDMTVFSFHPVKSITTGEGGAVLTNDETLYKKMKRFITHGVVKENFVLPSHGPWYFEQQVLGYNYRLTDMQCALGRSQLRRLDEFISKRRELAARYDSAFASAQNFILPPKDTADLHSAWHLYVIRLKENLYSKKSEIAQNLIDRGIGVQVHHVPVHIHPYYREHGFASVSLPETERWYNGALSLPLYPGLMEEEQNHVINAIIDVIEHG